MDRADSSSRGRGRSSPYSSLTHSVSRGITSGSSVGQRIILPSSFTGGPRYLYQNYQDSIAICRKYGCPDLFVTFTSNAAWHEITKALSSIPGQYPSHRPDIVSRVFKMKLNMLMDDIKKKELFGPINAVIYTVEFQKRGLPHVHIILWLAKDAPLDARKINTSNAAWPEITEALSSILGQYPSDRPDIVNRVFKMKLNMLMDDIKKKEFFGPINTVIYTVEFQKHGLPHVHIILWLAKDAPLDARKIFFIISAQLPDLTNDPIGYDVVSSFMIHGPCGNINNLSPCMPASSFQGGVTYSTIAKIASIVPSVRWYYRRCKICDKGYSTNSDAPICVCLVSSPKPIYKLPLTLTDPSGSLDAIAFSSVAESLVEHDAVQASPNMKIDAGDHVVALDNAIGKMRLFYIGMKTDSATKFQISYVIKKSFSVDNTNPSPMLLALESSQSKELFSLPTSNNTSSQSEIDLNPEASQYNTPPNDPSATVHTEKTQIRISSTKRRIDFIEVNNDNSQRTINENHDNNPAIFYNENSANQQPKRPN